MACTDEASMACPKEVSLENNVCLKYPHCERGVKLFGVRLTDGMIRKSVSMGNLAGYGGSLLMRCSLREHLESGEGRLAADPQGYVSDGLVQNCGALRERKKGVPWTEEEHRLFLVGLQKLGKGDWRGISRNFVPSRTPTQVASHAQKYFLRQSNLGKRRRRSSLFDIITTNTVVSVDCSSRVAPSPPNAIEESPLFTLPRASSGCSETVGVSAELCLGRSTEQQQLQRQKTQLTLTEWKQPTRSTMPHVGFLDSSSTDSDAIPPKATIASIPARDFWMPTSQLFPMYRVAEAMEPSSSLRLSIGPPCLPLEQPLELSLKLEQPAVSKHSLFHSSMPVAMVPKSSRSSLNAIRVV